MSRQFVRSLILAAVLGTANAGPCKPFGTTTAVSMETSTDIVSTIETSTGVVSPVETESVLFSSATDALASTTDETITTTIDIATTTETSSMSNSETETPTTTTAGDTSTTTEATTTASATSTCTPPEGIVCGRQGYRITSNGYVGLGSSGTVAECMQSCLDASGCVIAVFEQDSVCELWSEIPGLDGSESSLKWYQPACFCIDDAAPTN
ncbi:hypothetical protein NW752_004308 [Fusarium irregulare]|uniref:Apple domain-containing protein n=1 Tax=Fusarium irregulare TaxID=2494466 RepID=A0A9W8PPM9_9HYPO|nr:hypothetical protein NW766_007210 [Fusarium irregulare]KAJ4021301.1 hypothetical protein NW752_004308 [Fusarium irregulare]